jgi:hypothetical protein
MEEPEKDWKLRLRYDKLVTPYKHYTVIAEGKAGILGEGFECPEGNAFMGMKIWAKSPEESADVFQSVGKQIGFTVTGKMEIFKSDPIQPPGENPFGYDIKFTPF